MDRFYHNLLGKRPGLAGPLGKAAALAEAKAWLRDLTQDEAAKRVAHLTQGVARSKDRPALPLLSKMPAAPGGAGAQARPYAHPYYARVSQVLRFIWQAHGWQPVGFRGGSLVIKNRRTCETLAYWAAFVLIGDPD